MDKTMIYLDRTEILGFGSKWQQSVAANFSINFSRGFLRPKYCLTVVARVHNREESI